MTVVRVVWCGSCNGEGRVRPSRLGEVVELPRPFGQPRLLWHGHDSPSAQKVRNLRCVRPGNHDSHVCDIDGDPPVTRHYWVTLADPEDPALEVPEQLPVLCKIHGAGTVSSTDVIDKRAKVVPFTASH